MSYIRIFLIRHGESEANVDHSVYRKIPDRLIELTERGLEQAESVGKFFLKNKNKININNGNTLFACSSYVRAIETADKIKESIKLNYFIDDRIVEHNSGLFSGLTREQILEIYPKEGEYLFNQIDNKNSYFARFPMGESPSDVSVRINSFIEDLFKMALNSQIENIIIVAHGTTNLVFKKMLMNYTVDEFEEFRHPKNCSVMCFDFNPISMEARDNKYIFIPES